ncbi:MAG: chorismate mutase [Candidatus Hydrothermarchaeales archaeon]
MSLEELRQRIDEIDRNIVRLLEERFEIVEDIAGIKRSRGLKIEDDARERKVRKNYSGAAKKLDEGFVEKLVDLILKQSKGIQRGTEKDE